MNCWLIRRRLLKMSPEELRARSSDYVESHLRHCPGCDRVRHIYLALNSDLKSGSMPKQEKLSRLKIDLTTQIEKRNSAAGDLMRKLDWWLMPERSLRWAMPLVIIGILGGVYISQTSNDPTYQNGFPNNLIITRGHTIVTLERDKGVHLSNIGAFSPESGVQASPKGVI